MISKKKKSAIINGKKGGRPTYQNSIRVNISGINFVILTESQYNSLLEKYGYNLFMKALNILDVWLSSGQKEAEKHLGKNNYAYFRSDGWVINEARFH